MRRQSRNAPVPHLVPVPLVILLEYATRAATIGEAITTIVLKRMKDMMAEQIANMSNLNRYHISRFKCLRSRPRVRTCKTCF